LCSVSPVSELWLLYCYVVLGWCVVFGLGFCGLVVVYTCLVGFVVDVCCGVGSVVSRMSRSVGETGAGPEEEKQERGGTAGGQRNIKKAAEKEVGGREG